MVGCTVQATPYPSTAPPPLPIFSFVPLNIIYLLENALLKFKAKKIISTISINARNVRSSLFQDS